MKIYYSALHVQRNSDCWTEYTSKRTTLFWVITQRVVAISYRRFGTTYVSHRQGSRIQEECV